MLKRNLRLAPLLAAGGVFAAACGDSLPTGTNSGDQLDADEVQELVVELFDLLETIDVNIPGLQVTDPRLFLSRAGVPIDETFSDSDPCDAGGTALVSGTAQGDVDDETGVGDVTIDATVDFTNCEVEGAEVTYTLQGDPELGIVAEFELGAESITLRIEVGGGFAFATDDEREGTCAVDFNVTITASETTFTETLTGSVCGVNASSLETELFDDETL